MEEHILVLREGEGGKTLARSSICVTNEDTPPSHVLNKLVDVDGLHPHLDTLHHGIQYYEGSCMPHPHTAVDQEGNPLALVLSLLYPPHKAEDGGGKLGYPMVWPGGVVEVSYLTRFCTRLHLLEGGARGVVM